MKRSSDTDVLRRSAPQRSSLSENVLLARIGKLVGGADRRHCRIVRTGNMQAAMFALVSEHGVYTFCWPREKDSDAVQPRCVVQR